MLHLATLTSTASSGLTPAMSAVLAEAASVCLDGEGHSLSSEIALVGAYSGSTALVRLNVTDQMRSTYADEEEATEYGAYGVSILLVMNKEGRRVVRRSAKQNGFDYYMGAPSQNLSFVGQLRLEVSGIRRGSDVNVNARLKQKLQRLQQYPEPLTPVLISIVEFSRPMCLTEKRHDI